MTELEFMLIVWHEWSSRCSRVDCTECGIGLNFHPAHVAHIYGKGTEPQMRLDIENVIPMCRDCHDLFDKDLRVKMVCYSHVKKRMEYLKRKHAKRNFIEELRSYGGPLEERDRREWIGSGKIYYVHPDHRKAS